MTCPQVFAAWGTSKTPRWSGLMQAAKVAPLGIPSFLLGREALHTCQTLGQGTPRTCSDAHPSQAKPPHLSSGRWNLTWPTKCFHLADIQIVTLVNLFLSHMCPERMKHVCCGFGTRTQTRQRYQDIYLALLTRSRLLPRPYLSSTSPPTSKILNTFTTCWDHMASN